MHLRNSNVYMCKTFIQSTGGVCAYLLILSHLTRWLVLFCSFQRPEVWLKGREYRAMTWHRMGDSHVGIVWSYWCSCLGWFLANIIIRDRHAPKKVVWFGAALELTHKLTPKGPTQTEPSEFSSSFLLAMGERRRGPLSQGQEKGVERSRRVNWLPAS